MLKYDHVSKVNRTGLYAVGLSAQKTSINLVITLLGQSNVMVTKLKRTTKYKLLL